MKKKGFLGGLFGAKQQAEASEQKNTAELGVIKILGSGCKNCTVLAKNTQAALKELKLEAKVEEVTDLVAIASYGVMSTPALVVNEEVAAYGKVLSAAEVAEILQKLLK